MSHPCPGPNHLSATSATAARSTHRVRLRAMGCGFPRYAPRRFHAHRHLTRRSSPPHPTGPTGIGPSSCRNDQHSAYHFRCPRKEGTREQRADVTTAPSGGGRRQSGTDLFRECRPSTGPDHPHPNRGGTCPPESLSVPPPRSLSLVDPTTPERISHSRGISPYRRGRKPRVARSSQPASIDAALETRPSEIRLKGRIRCWDDDPTQRRCRTVPPPFRRTDMQGGGTNRRRTTGSGRSLATSTRNPASFRGIFAVSASGSP